MSNLNGQRLFILNNINHFIYDDNDAGDYGSDGDGDGDGIGI